MTRPSGEPDTPTTEPLLAEIDDLRRLISLEVAPPAARDQVLSSARRELAAGPPARSPWAMGRPWSIALFALGTSTALAATPGGRELLRDLQAVVAGSAGGAAETKAAPVARREARPAGDREGTKPEGGTLLSPPPDLAVQEEQEQPTPETAPSPAASERRVQKRQYVPPAPSAAETKELDAEERKLVEQARFALGQGRYRDAGLLSEEHRRRFPRGKLGPERDAIERQVRAASGSSGD